MDEDKKLGGAAACGNRTAMFVGPNAYFKHQEMQGPNELPEVLLASTNLGKEREFKCLFEGILNLVPASIRFPEIPAIEETESTLEENALLKAKETTLFTSMPSLGDDSGLFIDALNGEPGVISARYADNDPDFPVVEGDSRMGRCIQKVLKRMSAVPDHARGATFICYLAFVAPSGDMILTTGRWRGFIAKEPRGDNGFGYDSIFIGSHDFNGVSLRNPSEQLTAAQLPDNCKNYFSHRAVASAAMAKHLRLFFG